MLKRAVRAVVLAGVAVSVSMCAGDGSRSTAPDGGISLTATSLSATLRAGIDSGVQSVTVTSDRSGVAWTASSNATWIRLSTTSGVTPATIVITLRSDGLSVGNHSGIITISGPGGDNAAISLVVSLVVVARPILVVTTDTLRFAGAVGQSDLGTRSIAISNGGSGTLTWSAAPSDAWIAVAPRTGSGDGTVTVGVNTATLAAGTYRGTVQITATDASGSPTTVPVVLVLTQVYTVTALASPADGGSVTGGGDYPVSATATVTATAATGFNFVGWTENGRVVADAPTYAFLVSGPRSLVANFRAVTFTVATSVNVAGIGTTTGAGTYPAGSSVTVAAEPNHGYAFVNWTEGGVVVSASATYTFTLDANRSLVANFATIPPTSNVYTQAQPSVGGTTAGDGTYAFGATVTVTATPNQGYVFVNWTDGATVVATMPSYSFQVKGGGTLMAHFAFAPGATFTVATSVNPAGAGSINGAGTYPAGSSVTVVAGPSSGYAFVNWTEGGVVRSGNATYTFTLDASRSLVANFTTVPPVRVTVSQPFANQIVGDTLSIAASVTSTSQLASVRATVSGRTVSLAPSAPWRGTLDLAGLGRGPLDLMVTATDVNGTSGSATLTFIHDRAPTITITAPGDFNIARPSLSYAATCADDDPAGCTSLTLRTENGAQLASGTSSISGTTTLASPDGSSLDLIFKAVDSRGTAVEVKRRVFVETSTRITPIGTAPGTVVDVRSGRALYRAPADSFDFYFWIRTLSSGADERIQTPDSIHATFAFLTPFGTIFDAALRNSTQHRLYEWRSGTLITSTEQPSGLVVNGQYALFGLGGTSQTGTTVYRRDLLSGTDVVIGTQISNSGNDVAPNGSVAYSKRDYDIYWYRNGATTRLTNDDDAVSRNVDPMTDGTYVVYRKEFPTSATGTPPPRIMMHDGLTETLLAQGSATHGIHYDINNGWIAFRLASQIWVRSPTGVLRQASAVGSSPLIDALGSDGTVVFTAGGRRYMTAPGGTQRDVSSDLGDVVWRDGEFFLMLGGTVWRIPPA